MEGELPDLPAGTQVFIDSNIFVYHFTGVSSQCTQFLQRCEQGELVGITGVNVLLEVSHRLMMIEAVVKKLIMPGNVAKKLKARPDVVKQLKDYQDQLRAILEMGLDILSLSAEGLTANVRYRQDHGLLVNDSVTAALALGAGVRSLASADQDFERVEEVVLYRPTDIVSEM